ncbi:MAG: protein ImuB [Cryptosporangiaceae bacterium]|nr:protein ImuB [Cryptosporangiaceae bacterium]
MAGKGSREAPVRTAAVWCPDWPVAAAAAAEGMAAHLPAAIIYGNAVIACSEVARADGVRRGLRRREAQARCPELVIFAHDPGRDARAFEPVVAAVEELAPGVEVVRPGLCAFAARGPVRYFGGEAEVAERIVDQVAGCGAEALVGIADGVFAASLAARRAALVPPGTTRKFLAGFDIGVLDRPELADLMRRLGVRTLGQFAALPARDVAARFGPDGALAHRLARGLSERPLVARTAPVDTTVSSELDPPVDRVDTAAFAARTLAEQLHERLAGHGIACTRLRIEALTGNGEELSRVWRHDGVLTASDVADRVRWQLDGWLTGRSGDVRPTAGISVLRLIPEEIVEYGGLQLGLWGDVGESDERAHRVLARVQGMLGPEAVLTAVLGGGRGPDDRVRFVPWRDERTPGRPDAPWPGRLPSPSPAEILTEPVPAVVLAADGSAVGVTGRAEVSAAPASVAVQGGPRRAIRAWAGPWPVEERWWDPPAARRRARFQVLADDPAAGQVALLLSVANGSWWAEAIYG